MAIVTFTTDFGQQDHYVAAMKGVVLQIAPKSILVDVTHQIAPQNIIQAAFIIRQVWTSFPSDTIHVVVVDPAVGTPRRIVAVQYANQVVVCPDNGIVSFLQRDLPLEGLREVTNRGLFARSVSSTFHGRDIIAPVAAHLSRGVRISEVGPQTDRLEMLDLPRPERLPDQSIRGQVVYVDGFGNLVTNLTREELAHTFNVRPGAHVWLDELDLGTVRQTYALTEPDHPLALIGSVGMLEIAVNRGNAARHLGAGVGSPVLVR